MKERRREFWKARKRIIVLYWHITPRFASYDIQMGSLEDWSSTMKVFNSSVHAELDKKITFG